MVIPIHEQRRAGSGTGDSIIRTISTRIAGGGKTATAEPSQVRARHNQGFTVPNPDNPFAFLK